EDVGAWTISGRHLAVMIVPDESKRGAAIEMTLLNPQMAFSPSRAALLNGCHEPVTQKGVAVGMGALGSHVFMNLLRGGFVGPALCLSGGGFRATLFHLRSLRRLNELGALSRLDTITSVSGGSITNGVLATRWSRLRLRADGVFSNFDE